MMATASSRASTHMAGEERNIGWWLQGGEEEWEGVRQSRSWG